MTKRRPVDAWVAPSKEDRLLLKLQQAAVPSPELTLDQRFAIATLDRSLPKVDFHGMFRDDVRFGIDDFLARYPGEMVRVVYGYGTGVIASEVIKYLRQLSQGKGAKIEGYREDPGLASCVVKVKDR